MGQFNVIKQKDMKNIFRYIVFVSFVVALVACTEEASMPTLTKSTAPVLDNPDGSLEYVFTEENAGNPFETFIYTSADYGLPIITNYTIELATAEDTDFANKVDMQEASTVLYQTISIGSFNLMMGQAGLKLEPEKQSTIQVRVRAQSSNADVGVLHSNAVMLKVTPFDATIPPIYAVGDATEADWSPENGIPLPSVSASGYSATIALEADPKTFRFLPTNEGWDGGFFYGYFDVVESVPSGLVKPVVNEYDETNFAVTEAGSYLIEVDMNNNGRKTIKFTKQ